MTDDKREWARPVEEVALAILSKVPEGYGMTKSEAADYARVAIATLRRLGMIHEDGLKAIREEERK